MSGSKPKSGSNRESFEEVAAKMQEERPLDDVLRQIVKPQPKGGSENKDGGK